MEDSLNSQISNLVRYSQT